MGTREYIIKNEKTYKGVKDIKYLFCEGKGSNKLIITFPGFPGEFGGPPTYNYVRTLKNAECHRLFILDDYGPTDGSYLIGENRDFSLEVSVMSLVYDICKKYGIKSEDILSQGSSKGGYIALYYGLKYGFGNVIAGGPQTILGIYLSYVYPEIIEFIAGGDDTEDIAYLDGLLYSLIEFPSKKFPKIFIHVGRGDHHYKGHILPFIGKLEEKEIEYKLDLGNYDTHSDVGFYYHNYLLDTLNSIDSNIIKLYPPIQNLDIEYKNNLLKITCNAEGEKLEYACDIIKEFRIIKRIKYQKENNFRHLIKSNGTYFAMVYIKEGNYINSRYTNKIQIYNLYKPIRSDGDLDKIVSFNIHGSSISRLIFDFGLDCEFVLRNYISNQSFISTVSDPFLDKFNVKMLSHWEKSMVEMDLKKELFKKLSDDKSEYLLIDFVDERNALVKYENSFFTFTDVMDNLKFWNGFNVEYINKLDIDESFWKNSMNSYVEGLLEIYNEDNIIIHEVYLKDIYISKNGVIRSFEDEHLKYIKKVNTLLEKYYSYLKEKLPNSEVINISNNYLPSEDHIWGLSPIHYEDRYYQGVQEKIRNIIIKKSKPESTKTYKDLIKDFKNKLKFQTS